MSVPITIRVPDNQRTQPAERPSGSAKPSRTVSISQIINEGILLLYLQKGDSVIVYRGFDPKHLPQVGQEYVRPHLGEIRREIDRLLEEVRQKDFPSSPSRHKSVFATTSIQDAADHGEVYLLRLSLKPAAKNSSQLPLRWLERDIFEALPSSTDGKLEEIDARDTAKEYWASSGSHRFPADIVIDPKLVEIFVLEKAQTFG